MYLLDTNIISELRKPQGKVNAGVVDWADAVPGPLMFLSVISLRELEQGVLLAERRDRPKGEILRYWLDNNVLASFRDRLVPIDADIALRAAELHVPDPAPERDALIGASALAHGMAVVTHNTKDFERFADLDVINPWT